MKSFNLLQSSDLFKEISSDMNELYPYADKSVLLLCYLTASSRKMKNPYSLVLVQNESSGQNGIFNMIQKLIPFDDIVSVPLSFSALEHLSEDKFINKLWLLDEVNPYDKMVIQLIRQITGENELVWMKSVIKEKAEVKQIKRKCRVSLFLSTKFKKVTIQSCKGWFIVNLNESIKTTIPLKADTNSIVEKHIEAQRLLKEIEVINPFREQLTDVNTKILDLVECVCFVRQYQKEVKAKDDITFIEADLKDYEVAYEIGKQIFK